MKEIIIIKLGSSILMTHEGKLDEFRIMHIADQVRLLAKKCVGVVLVVSGAVACGDFSVAVSGKSDFLRQAAAGIGQAILISTFRAIFSQKNMQICQLLLTKDSLAKETGRKRVRELLEFYIESGLVAVMNENDVIELNSFGGNDYLASKIAVLVHAKRFLILSTYDTSRFGVGGGQTKQNVLKLMNKEKIPTEILNGKAQNTILNAIL